MCSLRNEVVALKFMSIYAEDTFLMYFFWAKCRLKNYCGKMHITDTLPF